MAIKCAICHNKQSGWYEDYPLSENHKSMRICATCQGHKLTLEKSTNAKDWNEALAYFKNIFQSADTCKEAKDTIRDIVEKRKPVAKPPAVTVSDLRKMILQELTAEVEAANQSIRELKGEICSARDLQSTIPGGGLLAAAAENSWEKDITQRQQQINAINEKYSWHNRMLSQYKSK